MHEIGEVLELFYHEENWIPIHLIVTVTSYNIDNKSIIVMDDIGNYYEIIQPYNHDIDPFAYYLKYADGRMIHCYLRSRT